MLYINFTICVFCLCSGDKATAGPVYYAFEPEKVKFGQVELGSLPPFAIVSSTVQSTTGDGLVRPYAWGSINIMDTKYSDFEHLK